MVDAVEGDPRFYQRRDQPEDREKLVAKNVEHWKVVSPITTDAITASEAPQTDRPLRKIWLMLQKSQGTPLSGKNMKLTSKFALHNRSLRR
jgi:hypothetical protein